MLLSGHLLEQSIPKYYSLNDLIFMKNPQVRLLGGVLAGRMVCHNFLKDRKIFLMFMKDDPTIQVG